MSLPEFPSITPPLSREDAINQIISSIAMEELALSHIINAEGEKLQYILGTIPGSTGPQPTIQQILDINESVRSVLQSTAEAQAVLRSKLQSALSASVMRGATGATGATGAPGIAEAAGFQAGMADAPDLIEPNDNFIFNRVLYDGSADISYDDTTGIFTVNQSGEYDFYVITFWFHSEGYDDTFPYSVSLNVNGAVYSVLDVHYTETQVSSSAIVPTEAGTMTISVSNSSTGTIALPEAGIQSKITFLGYKSAA